MTPVEQPPVKQIKLPGVTAAQALAGAAGSSAEYVRASIYDLRNTFACLAESAAKSSNDDLAKAAATMADLLTAAAIFSEDPAAAVRAEELIEFTLTEAMTITSEFRSPDQIRSLTRQVEVRWSDCLSMLAPEEKYICPGNTAWSEPSMNTWETFQDLEPENTLDPDDQTPFPGQMNLREILSSVIHSDDETHSSGSSTGPAEIPQNEDATLLLRPPADGETIDDPELVAAYADDAHLCLAEMEASLLNPESGRLTAEGLNNFCRQLHTLKGASGTAGLSTLAGYLHQIESWIEATSGTNVSIDKLLECIDTVRRQLDTLGVADTTATTSPRSVQSEADSLISGDPLRTRHSGTDAENDVFVRVEASRLERLMDLLAELVMLRNHRDTHVESLRTIHTELNLCATRSRTLTAMMDFPALGSPRKDDTATVDYRLQSTSVRFLSRSMSELAGDTAELSRSLQEVFEPLSRNNSSVSHLIGCFRQELMELRRLPVGGLFQRLQRAIHDAAKAEGKQVEIRLEGQGARAERGLQQRLFEPLLHLVRNAVSHGIQSAAERVRQGKPSVGRITLSAWSDAASLTLEVRDDGNGLNEAAIESRGRELGLLPPGEAVTSLQLRQLIFHPGFSTRSTVSEISGRGVGMDVVDNWVRRLRGRIDVETTLGLGTAFRLRIPLRSAVEHAMIVRAGGQLFALPMHTVSGTSDAKLPESGIRMTPDTQAVPLCRLLQLPETQNVRACLVTLRGTEKQTASPRIAARDNLTITVDEIAGVEEVVVRPLPTLLHRNELFAGVTLSGRAETVLVLDTGRLLELGSQTEDCHRTSPGSGSMRKDRDHSADAGGHRDQRPEASEGNCILIVDDSVVVRRGLAKKLNAAGYRTQEAGDGHAALKHLRNGLIAAVVSDVDMPGMDGVELLREMRRQKQFRTIPVAVLSSRDKHSMPPEMALLQPETVLAKPITDETIKAILTTFSQAGVLYSAQTSFLHKH